MGSKAQAVNFSQDGHFLAQFNRYNLINWDLQTGGPACTIPHHGLCIDPQNFSSVYSMDGKMLAAVYNYPKGKYLDNKYLVEDCLGEESWVEEPFHHTDVFIATHDLTKSCTHLYLVSDGHIVLPIWIHGQHLRFATAKPGYITICIWEAPFTSIHAPEVVKSLPTPHGTSYERISLFVPNLS